MSYKLVNRSLKPLLMIFLLICCVALVARSPRTAYSARTSQAPVPLHLRVKVQNNSIRSGEATRVTAEFLDRLYQPVPNDGTRVVEFGFGASGAPGTLSPRSVKVGAGAWSADTTFTSRQTGKVTITARAEGLDQGQTVVIVRPTSSFLPQLFDPVAYAQDDGFDISPETSVKAQANGNSRITFRLSFLKAPPEGTRARVRVNPPAKIIYAGETRGAQTNVTFTDGVSDPIDVISSEAGTMSINARVLPNGEEKSASLEFVAPEASRVWFDDDLKEINSTVHTIPICIKLIDENQRPTEAKSETLVTLKAANDDDPISFEPASVVFSPSHHQVLAQTILHLRGLPPGGELTLRAIPPENSNLIIGSKTIKIQSPIKGVTLSGPPEVTRGSTDAEYIVRLTDKDDKPMAADWDRKIRLSASYGKFIPEELTIPKGQDFERVQYVSAKTTGKVSLRAESRGLKDGSQEIVLITAVYWLVLFSLLGGLLGGVVRNFSVENSSMNWRRSVGCITGSIASGLFLYLAMKLGLSRALGGLALPLDYGTWLVAFFFGGVGGFAGPVVFEWLVSLILGPGQKVQAQPATGAA